jgi:hypothetical protein
MYRIIIVKKAGDDLNWFRKNDKSSYIKSFDLTRELIEHPRTGTGNEILDEAAHRLVSHFQPERIILFGSQARGGAYEAKKHLLP